MKTTQQYRQGDVWLTPVSEIPKTAKPQRRKKNEPVTLALGEVTGHSHHIKTGKVRLYKEPGTLATFLEVKEAMAELRHEEHATIPVPPGIYRVKIQREYVPKELPRNVAD